jgi:hypothetical protein
MDIKAKELKIVISKLSSALMDMINADNCGTRFVARTARLLYGGIL